MIGRNAKTPTNWEEGIAAIKAAIGKYSNEVMARYKLMFQMPASDYADWRKWSQELLEQAKRCKWEEYLAEQAALDALLYQCPNQQWKDKIMEGTLNFQEVINWGMTKLKAKQEGKKIGGKPEQDSPVLPVDKVSTETKTFECKKCFEKHAPRECPAFGYQCSKCHRPNHLANSKECKKEPPNGAERPSRGRWQRGQRGRGGQGEGRGRGRGGPPDLSHERGNDRSYDRRAPPNRDGDYKTVYVPTKDGGLRKSSVRFLDEARSNKDDRGYDDFREGFRLHPGQEPQRGH